jgi:PAS domain S-box-containing protein
MSHTGHLSELDSLRSQVVDLSRQLSERDCLVQDLWEQFELLRAIVEGTAAETGEEFFATLVTHLTAVLHVKYALIGEVQGDRIKKIRTLAVSAGGVLVDNFDYELADTPCATALTQSFTCFDRDVQGTFPQFQRLADLGAESYCAVPIWTKGGAAVGLLVVMDTKALEHRDFLPSLLGVFAPRIAAEFERRRADQERAQALADLHNVIETIPDIVFALDTQGNVVKWNRRLVDVTGYSPEELLNMPALAFVPPEEQARTAAAIQRAFTEGYTELEGHLLTKEHRLIPYHWTGALLKNSHGQPIGITGIGRDVLAKKRAEEALQVSEERLRAVFENAAVGIAVGSHTTGTGIDQVNPVFAAMLGYTSEELCYLGMKGITFPDDLPASREFVSQLVGGTKRHGTIEKRYVKKDGLPIWAQTTVSSILDKQGHYLNSIALIQDINERKQAEEALAQSEERYRSLVNNAPIGIFVNEGGQFVYANREFQRIVDAKSVEQLLGMPVLDRIAPEFHNVVKDRIHQLMEKGLPVPSLDEQYVRLDGSRVDVAVTAIPASFGGLPVVQVLVLDITERKRAEEALRESEQAIRALHETTAASGLSFDERIQRVLEVGCRRFKLPIGMLTQVVRNKLELVQVWAPGTDFTAGMAVPLGSTYCNTTLQESEPVCFEHAEVSDWRNHPGYKALGLESYIGTKLIGRDQVYGTVCFMGQDPFPAPFSQADKDFIQLMARWISGELDRQKAEQALKHSEERYRALYDDTPTMYFTLATDGMVRSVNRFGAEQLGYRVEDLIGHSVLGVIHEQDKGTVAACLSECLATPETTRHWEFRKIRKDGTVIWVRETACVGQSSTGETVVLVTCEDVTEHRRMEEALRKSEHYNRILFENSPIGLVLCQLDGTIADCNERYGDILGRNRSDILGKTYWELTPEKYRDRALLIVETLCHTGRFGPYEKEYIHAAGHLVPVRLFGSLIDKDGELCMVCSVEDITERKRVEEELQKSHAFLRQVIDIDPNFIFAKDREGRFTLVNQAVADVYGTTVANLVGKTDADFNPNQEEVAFFRQKDLNVMDSRQDLLIPEEVITDSAGNIRWLQTVKRPILDWQGSATMVLGAATDITDRKRMEEMLRQRERDLRAALDERERISQDLHDGILQSLFAVGLNLEVTKSLMPPKTRKASGASLNKAIDQLNLVMREVRNFIAGLDPEPIEGKDLSTALQSMLTSLTENQPTRVRLAVEKRAVQAVSAEQSFHLVRVIQEAVSNCIRHGGAQEARVSLKMLKQGVRLSIRDNGRGFNQDTVKAGGYGLRNMAARAQKISGRFTVLSKENEGTRIILDLPKETSDASH